MLLAHALILAIFICFCSEDVARVMGHTSWSTLHLRAPITMLRSIFIFIVASFESLSLTRSSFINLK